MKFAKNAYELLISPRCVATLLWEIKKLTFCRYLAYMEEMQSAFQVQRS